MANKQTFRVSFHTNSRDKRRDPVTNTVTKYFSTIEAAEAFGKANSQHFNLYQFHEGLGWWSWHCPLPERGAA